MNKKIKLLASSLPLLSMMAFFVCHNSNADKCRSLFENVAHR